MNKAIFLDRDGTINKDFHYVCSPGKFELLPGVEDALRHFEDLGYLLIIVTNQSGVARGFFTEKDVIRFNQWTISFFLEKGIRIHKIYYCPHLPYGKVSEYAIDCDCRKPKTGLFKKATIENDLSIADSIVIGDKISDCTLAIQGLCDGYLVGDTESQDTIRQVAGGLYPHLKYEKNLLDCSLKITKGSV